MTHLTIQRALAAAAEVPGDPLLQATAQIIRHCRNEGLRVMSAQRSAHRLEAVRQAMEENRDLTDAELKDETPKTDARPGPIPVPRSLELANQTARALLDHTGDGPGTEFWPGTTAHSRDHGPVQVVATDMDGVCHVRPVDSDPEEPTIAVNPYSLRHPTPHPAPEPATHTLSRARFTELLRAESTLRALCEAGVESWPGYDQAVATHES